jgi:hypothetical protein
VVFPAHLGAVDIVSMKAAPLAPGGFCLWEAIPAFSAKTAATGKTGHRPTQTTPEPNAVTIAEFSLTREIVNRRLQPVRSLLGVPIFFSTIGRAALYALSNCAKLPAKYGKSSFVFARATSSFMFARVAFRTVSFAWSSGCRPRLKTSKRW